MWLSLACGAGSSAPELLFSRFGFSAQKIYDATPDEYREISGLKKGLISALENKNLSKAHAIVRWCAENGVGLLPYDSEYFPNSLRIIKNAPVLLYYLGHVPDINRRLSIAVVGTRDMTDYGSSNTYSVSSDLAMAGVVIVSGLALGVDGSAHRGALDAGGYTIAVLGCGIDRIYPKCHANLMHEIALKGTVVTEYCPGTPPNAANFPMRNRIISGLAQGTVVFEADARSGALITAKRAREQGRPVYALPGKVGELTSEGTNMLIQAGAKMITDAFDVLKDYMESYSSVLNVDSIMNKLCKYRTGFRYKNIKDGGRLPNYPKLGKYNSNPGRVYADDGADSPRTPIATEVEQFSYSPLPGRTKKQPAAATKSKEKTTAAPKEINLSGDARAVYDLIPDTDGITHDELLRSFSDRGKLMMILTELEMEGFISSCRGGYVRTRLK